MSCTIIDLYVVVSFDEVDPSTTCTHVPSAEPLRNTLVEQTMNSPKIQLMCKVHKGHPQIKRRHTIMACARQKKIYY